MSKNDLLVERDFLWRAIDLLVQEIGGRGDTSQWFRGEWEALVNQRKAHQQEESGS